MDPATNGICGVWKLRSYARRFLDTGEVRKDMLPHAYILYTPGGFMMSVTVEENRAPPAGPVLTDAERIRLFNSIVSAYAGTYSIASRSRSTSSTGRRLSRSTSRTTTSSPFIRDSATLSIATI